MTLQVGERDKVMEPYRFPVLTSSHACDVYLNVRVKYML